MLTFTIIYLRTISCALIFAIKIKIGFITTNDELIMLHYQFPAANEGLIFLVLLKNSDAKKVAKIIFQIYNLSTKLNHNFLNFL